jgi:hypothetical protein
MNGNVIRQWTKPSGWYRSLFFIVGGQQQFNFDGDLTDRQGQIYVSMQALNYWNMSAFWIYRPSLLDDRLARGGPVLKRPNSNFFSANVSSDSRKALVLSLFGDAGCNGDGSCSRDLGVTALMRPQSSISVSIGPSYGHSETGFQYVTTVADTTATSFYGHRYVFAGLTQNTLSMDTRVNITFTTNLTFEMFLQPLVASGDYDRYNEFAAPRERQRLVYGEDIGTATVIPGVPNSIVIDPDGTGPAAPFTIADPSFTFRSLRGNAVLRWEYRPGSTLFFVWTRSSSSTESRGNIDFNTDASAVFRGSATNIFLVKVNYRIGF